MSIILREHIRKFIELPDKDYQSILGYFRVLNPKKKEILLMEGQICKSNYFVSNGCLRMYFIDEKGVERTTHFAIENWWLADYFSFQSQKPSQFYIQAVEKCEIFTLDFKAQGEMLNQFPAMERYFRFVHQTANAASQVRMRHLYGQSREEMYHSFCTLFPQFIQRVPQYLLASYLNMTPEYLSELRAKFFLKLD